MLGGWLRKLFGLNGPSASEAAIAAQMRINLSDDTPFGADLARQAVRVLKTRRNTGTLHALVRLHRDYTGHGLYYEADSGAFYISASLDGLPEGAPLISFTDETAFVDWLARQSDLSLSGYQQPNMFQNDAYAGNQRITRAFLLTEIMRPVLTAM